MESASQLSYTAPAPGTPERLLLFALRRIALGGIDDAQASAALMVHFGLGFRRPLLLLRALILELSRVAGRSLIVAPCCCPRATPDERSLVDVIAIAGMGPREAHSRLRDLLAVSHCHAAIACAQGVAEAWHDLGRPLEPAID